MKYVWNGTKFVPKERRVSEHHYVMPDLEPFRNTDGSLIEGRRQWREHQKATGTMETDAKEMQAQTERWNSKRADFKARMNKAKPDEVRQVDVPVVEARDYEMSRINRELANRLDGRPMPDRKMLIKLTLETARMLRGR